MKTEKPITPPTPATWKPIVLIAIAAASLSFGCSSFNRDWKAAANLPYPGNELAGRWEGTWLSDVNGHTDQLRGLITRLGETNYSARFQAKYRKVMRFTASYTVPLSVEPQDNGSRFRGEADLGWLAGGIYRYEGHATATNFFSTYECKYDRGTFRMTRLLPER